MIDKFNLSLLESKRHDLAVKMGAAGNGACDDGCCNKV